MGIILIHPYEWWKKVARIDRHLKEQVRLLRNKKQSKYKCPCCEDPKLNSIDIGYVSHVMGCGP